MKKSNLMKKATSVFMSAVAVGTISSSAMVCHAEDPMGGVDPMGNVNPIMECLKEMPGHFFKEAGKAGGENAFLKFILGGKVKYGMILGKTLFGGSKDFYKCLREKGVTVDDFKDFAGGLWDITRGTGKKIFEFLMKKNSDILPIYEK